MSSNRWEIQKLGNLLGEKGYIRGPFGSSLKRGEMKLEGIPVYEQQHAIYNSREFRYFIDEDKFKELRRFQVKTNDLIISCSGTIGKVSIIKEDDPKGIISQALLILRPNNRKVLPEYLKYYFSTREGFNNLVSASHGSVQVNIASRAIVESIEFKLPDVTTQYNIVDILSALDEKIELNRQVNATLEAIAQSIFREWFVVGNYPATNMRDFDLNDGMRTMMDGDVGLPSGWRVVPLDQIAEFLNGLALQKYPAENEDDYLPVIKIRELKNGITSATDRASKNIPSKYIINDGDLLFSWSASLEVKFWVGGEGALNQHLFKVTSKEYPLWFCYLWILHHISSFRNIAQDKTTTMGHIQRRHLTEAMCIVPDNLLEMDNVIKPLIDMIINNEQQNATLASMRDGLLPRLMRGEVGV